MVRTLILGLLLLAAAQVAVADDTTTGPSTPALMASAPATTQPANATKPRAKAQSASTKPGDGKAEPAVEASQAGAQQPGGDVKMSGMSILGNEDAPKSLVLVPWKSSQLADMPSVSRLLDSSMQPVDKDVFMRELSYYEFKSGSK
jgi:hypothetical protein